MALQLFVTFLGLFSLTSTAAARAAVVTPLIRISCGGGAVDDFSADNYFTDGEIYGVASAIERPAANAAPEAVYQHERYGPDFSYTIPASTPPPGRSYTVRLHFAELYDNAAGKRLQNVSINGRRLLTHFDIFAEAQAKNRAIIKEFPDIVPENGIIEIHFTEDPGTADLNAEVNGIEVLANDFIPKLGSPAARHYPFLDPTLQTARRVNDLVSRMTLREKVSQMRYTAAGVARLGIQPYNWWNEALHGVARAGIATVFPQAIGLASTWDTRLHFQMADAIADEARAKYNDAIARGLHAQYFGLDFWSPNINIFRDPRWGRGQETYGEDPYLTGRFGVAFIHGMQGSDPRYLKVIATAKHFAVHSGPESLRHVFDAQPSPYDLNDTYLPAFEAAVREGHAGSVMGAYNSVDGVPACASAFLLQQTLRDRWGFEGYVVSDCGAISDIYRSHHFAKDAAEASADAVHAGCDLACDDAYSALVDAVNRHLIPEADIDRAVTRLFTARFRLGMFDPPAMVPYASIPISDNDSPAHRALAARVARESMVLLKNEGAQLPLPRTLTSVAVIGPNADNAHVLLGNYNGDTSHGVTILEGIRNKLGPAAVVGYEHGCDIKGNSQDGFAAAIALGQKSDVVIAVLGLSQSVEGEEGSGGGDRKELGLPGVQENLLEALAATGKPVVLVLINGSAIAINWASQHVPAILEAWYPGEEGGTAVADVLFGDVNPAGRLPVTFYRSTADLPAFTDYSMKSRTYRYFSGQPLYGFGDGLSYTQFRYSGLIAPGDIKANQGMVRVKATVRNTGDRPGDEVVELYLRPAPGPEGGRLIGAGQPMPRLVLGGFQRINLKVGEARQVTFTLSRDQLLLVNLRGERSLNPGRWEIYVGGHQPNLNAPANSECVSALMTMK